jgi:hypothetical protein
MVFDPIMWDYFLYNLISVKFFKKRGGIMVPIQKKKGVQFSFIVLVLAVFAMASTAVHASEKTFSTKQILQFEQQWEGTLHANHKLANETNHGAIIDPGGHDASCMKCHNAGGFQQWSKYDFVPPKDVEYASKPVEEGKALSVTCNTCHDPNADKEPYLRIVGKTPKLTGGFAINEDLGTGASCAICHTSNRGLRNDKEFPIATKHAPHEPSQADVMMGENFYFIQTGKMSPSVKEQENTCAGCHMVNGNHNMAASKKEFADVKKDVDAEFAKLKKGLERAISKFVRVGLKAGNFKVLHLSQDEVKDKEYTTFTEGDDIEVNISYFHGMQSAEIIIDDVSKFANIHNLISGGKKLLDTKQGQIIAKAGWNFYMIDHDGSFGAHNPEVVLEVLKVSQKNLKKLKYKKL